MFFDLANCRHKRDCNSCSFFRLMVGDREARLKTKEIWAEAICPCGFRWRLKPHKEAQLNWPQRTSRALGRFLFFLAGTGDAKPGSDLARVVRKPGVPPSAWRAGYNQTRWPTESLDHGLVELGDLDDQQVQSGQVRRHPLARQSRWESALPRLDCCLK